jgi:beta-hydroxylase
MFYPDHALPATALLREHWRLIRDECLALPSSDFVAWPEVELYNHGWDIYGMVAQRRRLLENCVFCPQTADLLRSLDGVVNAGFSRLAPGTRILPHVGYRHANVRYHLALQADGDCHLRVGEESRPWREGHSLLFEDMATHEAWNHGSQTRIVLLVDFDRTLLRDET